ncbi:MAG: hypothetical protein AABZ47_11565 [Planctomycetota bacterium]
MTDLELQGKFDKLTTDFEKEREDRRTESQKEREERRSDIKDSIRELRNLVFIAVGLFGAVSGTGAFLYMRSYAETQAEKIAQGKINEIVGGVELAEKNAKKAAEDAEQAWKDGREDLDNRIHKHNKEMRDLNDNVDKVWRERREEIDKGLDGHDQKVVKLCNDVREETAKFFQARKNEINNAIDETKNAVTEASAATKKASDSADQFREKWAGVEKEILQKRQEMQREIEAGKLPIGSISAWHKDLNGVPKFLPDGWIECTQNEDRTAVINVPGSPLNGIKVPDLNQTPVNGYQGGGRFLRGGTSSGVFQDATAHVLNTFLERGFGGSGASDEALLTFNHDGAISRSFTRFGMARTIIEPNYPQGFGYSRPVNMSVVWIMRVK